MWNFLDNHDINISNIDLDKFASLFMRLYYGLGVVNNIFNLNIML